MVSPALTHNDGKIIVLDSVAYTEEGHKGAVIVCGSHGGESAARHLLKFSPGGAIFNDAGKGKEDAGICGLKIFDEAGIPAAAVDAFSARIGDGTESFECGIISAINQHAERLGIKIGMTAREAAMRMLSRSTNSR